MEDPDESAASANSATRAMRVGRIETRLRNVNEEEEIAAIPAKPEIARQTDRIKRPDGRSRFESAPWSSTSRRWRELLKKMEAEVGIEPAYTALQAAA